MQTRLFLWSLTAALAGFLFFCFMMVLQLIRVNVMVPETNGRPLGEIEHDLG